MLAPKRTSPQKLAGLTVTFVAVLAAIGFVAYTNFVNVSTAPPTPEWVAEISRTARDRYPPVPPVNPNHPLFASPQFLRLKGFAPLPVVAGAVGRENPFAVIPYLGTATTAPPAAP